MLSASAVISFSERDKGLLQKLLTEAAKARRYAHRHRRAMSAVGDTVVAETLRSRIVELEALAHMLEAQAHKICVTSGVP